MKYLTFYFRYMLLLFAACMVALLFGYEVSILTFWFLLLLPNVPVLFALIYLFFHVNYFDEKDK